MSSRLLLPILLLSPMLHAELAIGKLQQFPATEQKGFYHPIFSPQGDFMLFSTESYKGLMYYDIATSTTRQLTDAENAGYGACISPGGKMVVFRKVVYVNNRRHIALQQLEIESSNERELYTPTRAKLSYAFNAGRIQVYQKGWRFSKRLLTDISEPLDTFAVVAIEDMDLVLYRDLKRYILNPIGKGSYLYPSLSPDGQRILFFAAHTGKAYTCDLHGKQLFCLGYIDAPVWVGNHYVVGMADQSDDGENYTASPLVFARYDGQERQEYSPKQHPIILYPSATQSGDKVAFAADGAVYWIPITIRK